jgi:MFS transporter, UMF1 family
LPLVANLRQVLFYPTKNPISMSQTTALPIKNDRRLMSAWAYFDCANSAHSLVIGTAVFPLFWKNLAPETVEFLGMNVPRTAMLSYALTIAYAVIALTQPILSGIADYGGKRKFFMQMFTFIGASACISMYWMQNSADWQIGFWAYIVSMIGYAGGVVFNNSFIPIIATPDQHDRLSARGFTLGYLGSTLLLVVTLAFIMTQPDDNKLNAMRITFILVGLWWIGFAQIPYFRLPKDANTPLSIAAVKSGFVELAAVWRTLRTQTNTKRFLAAFFFYDAGVQTIIFLAASFASEELKFGAVDLIVLVLVLQIVGAVGAWFFAKVSDKKGNKWTLMLMLAVWILITFLAYFTPDKNAFYALGVLLGIIMGGTQSLSRSTFSKLMPADTPDPTTFFSFYDLTDKLAVILGSFIFGYVAQMVGLRTSVLTMGILFVIGLVLLARVRMEKNS